MSIQLTPGRRRHADSVGTTGAAHAATRNGSAHAESPIHVTLWQQLAEAQQARAARLQRLWEMTPAQRVAAMRRGELTYEELAAWSARYPAQVPILHGEFEWLISKTPEVCE